jgi:hypothetical protein
MFVLFLFGYFVSICGLFLPNVGKINYTLLYIFMFSYSKLQEIQEECMKNTVR